MKWKIPPTIGRFYDPSSALLPRLVGFWCLGRKSLQRVPSWKRLEEICIIKPRKYATRWAGLSNRSLKKWGRTNSAPTWRITPVSKWLVTPIYKPFRPFVRGTTRSLGDLRSSWLLTTYKSWDDPPSRGPPIFRGVLRLLRKKLETRCCKWLMMTWVFPKIMGVYPQSIHFNRSLHYLIHPFWGVNPTPIFGNIHLWIYDSWLGLVSPPRIPVAIWRFTSGSLILKMEGRHPGGDWWLASWEGGQPNSSGQISIIPKPELRGFGGRIPLLNHNLRWPRRFGRYNLPRIHDLKTQKKHSHSGRTLEAALIYAAVTID